MKRTNLLSGFFFLLLVAVPAAGAGAEEKAVIGAVEEVLLLPWGVKLLARVDTGATTTSLDARHLKVEENIATFQLPDRYEGMVIRVPVVSWKEVRSAGGKEKRPVVEMDLCIGARRIRARVNLNDRSMVNHSLILGRNVLRRHFVVDVTRARVQDPVCPVPRKTEKQTPPAPHPLPIPE
jgi:hypothetical protein